MFWEEIKLISVRTYHKAFNEKFYYYLIALIVNCVKLSVRFDYKTVIFLINY